jgi:MFS family permease
VTPGPTRDTQAEAAPPGGVPADPPAGFDAPEQAPIITPARQQLARARYSVLTASHAFVDVFPILFIVLNLPLKERLGLTAWQVDAVYMATPIFSGALQPLFAFLSDKFNTRIFSPLGLALGCVCVGSIGFAQNFWQLIALQIIGVIGIGFYHPVSTALAGQTGSRAFAGSGGRALAVGVFIAAGMAGQSLSSFFSPRLIDAAGMTALAWYIIPGLLMAVVLHQVIRHIPHRAEGHEHHASTVPAAERAARWWVVGSLTVQNALRFTVNVGLFAMFNVWAAAKLLPAGFAELEGPAREAALRSVDAAGSKVAGTLIAATTIGMGLSVIISGRLSKHGHERFWLVALSLAGAVFVGSLGYAGDAMFPGGLASDAAAIEAPSTLELLPLCLLAALAPVGFFSTFPIAASLGQRLQPAHTSLVMSLLMGVGWAVSSSNTLLARLFLGEPIRDAPELAPQHVINNAFIWFALLLVIAAVLAAVMPKRIIASVADDH